MAHDGPVTWGICGHCVRMTPLQLLGGARLQPQPLAIEFVARDRAVMFTKAVGPMHRADSNARRSNRGLPVGTSSNSA